MKRLLLLCLLSLSLGLQAEDNRPNIILILCDDTGRLELDCYGSEISTPSLGSLAANCIRFTQFHNTAECWTMPSSLSTGMGREMPNPKAKKCKGKK